MTIAVLPKPNAVPPTNEITVSVPVGGVMQSVEVWRNDHNGKTDIRQQPSAGFDSRIVEDYECPFGESVTYGWTTNYIAAAVNLWSEAWASLAAWTIVGGSWSVSGGSLVWSAAIGDSTAATVTRTISAGQYRVAFAGRPKGFATIDFGGGISIDVLRSRLVAGSNSVLFNPGTTGWTINITGSTVSLATSAGTYSVDRGSVIAITQVSFVGAVRIPTYTSSILPDPISGNPFIGGHVAVDSTGNVYVVDGNLRGVRKYSPAGVLLLTFGTPGTGNGQFTFPTGIAIDSTNNVYVADSGAGRIQKFSSAGAYVSQFGSGSGPGNGQFNGGTVVGIAIDSTGAIYAVDPGNNRVQKFTSAGAYSAQFGTAGTGDGQFTIMQEIAVDASNNVYVMDGQRIQKFTSAGAFVSKFGTYGTGSAQFGQINGIAINSVGEIHVSDIGQINVRKFTAAGTYLGDVAPNGSDPGQVKFPQGLAFGPAGVLWLVDNPSTALGTTRIQRFDPAVTSTNGAVTVSTYPAPASLTEISAPVILDVQDMWIIHPGNPSLSLNLEYDDLDQSTLAEIGTTRFRSRAALHEILGTRKSIQVSNGARGAEEFTIAVSTETTSGRGSFEAIIADETPLLFHTPPGWDLEFPDGFYAVGDVEFERMVQTYGQPSRMVSLPLTAAENPVVDVGDTGWTFSDLYSEYDSFDDVLASFNSFADVYIDNPVS